MGVLVVAQGKYRSLEEPIEALGGKILKELGRSQAHVSVFLVDNATIKKLKFRYLGIRRSTDVLSFGVPKEFRSVWRHIPDPGERARLSRSLGEVYLAPDYIRAQGEDIIFLLIHGMLHLIGYDHEKKHDMIRMRRREKFLMSKVASQERKDKS